MRVAKRGKSLAVRLPETIVTALKLKPGDEIEIVVTGERAFQVQRDRSRERALARLRALKKPLPKGFRFDLLCSEDLQDGQRFGAVTAVNPFRGATS